MNRRRIPLQVREPEEMHRHLDSALADFRRAYPQYAPTEEPDTEAAASDVVESTAADVTDATSDVGPEPAATESAEAESSSPSRIPRRRIPSRSAARALAAAASATMVLPGTTGTAAARGSADAPRRLRLYDPQQLTPDGPGVGG